MGQVRRLITGTDDSGRSCVVEETPLVLEATSGRHRSARVYATDTTPPPARPPGRGSFADIGVAPGLARWFVDQFEPDVEFPMHHTDTIDFDVVLAGSLEIGLDDGRHLLEPGDCVVVTGVGHSWKAGPDGCVLSVTVIGTPPPVLGG